MTSKLPLLLCTLFLIIGLTSQAQKLGLELIDSLLTELPAAKEDTNKVKMLYKIAYTYPYFNPDEGIQFGKQALELAEKLNWQLGVADAYAALGANLANKADYPGALNYEYKALKIYEELNDLSRKAGMLRNIAIVLRASKNREKALEYAQNALSIYRQLKDSINMAVMYGNIANVYYSLKNKEKVLENNFQALELYEHLRNEQGTARIVGNIANFYAEEGDYNKAMVYYFDALRRETKIGNQNGVTRNMGNIGETYLDIYKNYNETIRTDSLIPKGRQNNLFKALDYLEKTIKSARELHQIDFYLAFGEVLSEAYSFSGKTQNAYDLYKAYIFVRDSVYNVEKINEAARKEMEYSFGKREDSIAFQKQIADLKWIDEKKLRSKEQLFFSIGLVLVLVFSYLMYRRWRITQTQKGIIEQEKKRSESLLLNILPLEVANELKEKGSAAARQFEDVTVMFTDFKNFTSISEKLSPQELVNEIHDCYSAFDQIISKHGIEKIKTIGDSYMCAGGLPVPNHTHAEDVVRAALDIRDFMAHRPAAYDTEPLAVRIGIHTGPVIAGIVGINKFAYDIWGDTVNTASRMESSGEAGKVNISGTTYALVKDKFTCIHRGKIAAKNKGVIDMYFLES